MSGWTEGVGHVLRYRLGDVLDEGGAPTVSSYSSSPSEGRRRVLGCSTGWRESCRAGHGPTLTAVFTLTGKCHPACNLQGGGSADFLVQTMSAQGRVKSPYFGCDLAQKKWTMSTTSTSDGSVPPPDCPGFRMFPPLPSVPKAWVPFESHLGHGIPPRQRGYLL